MKSILKIIPALALALCLASCGTTTKSDPFSVSPSLELRMTDLVFLGECEISCEYDTYIGFIRHLTKVNGEDYVPGDKVKLNVPGRGLAVSGKGMEIAAAKMLEKYPEARFFQVVLETKETDRAFLGSSTKRVAKVRVYKFK